MKILIADDDRVSRRTLEIVLGEWGYEVMVACDGTTAWQLLRGADAPQLAILDWIMPGMDGLEVCRRVREQTPHPVYLILLTSKGSRSDIVAGLRGGADDYLCKPFNVEELQARLQVGCRIVDLQRSLSDQVRQLEEALAKVSQLQGLLPICSYCKQIRDDQNYWQQVESYIAAHSRARFSHSICPTCYERVVQPQLDRIVHSRTTPA